jgi:hypothetical protein
MCNVFAICTLLYLGVTYFKREGEAYLAERSGLEGIHLFDALRYFSLACTTYCCELIDIGVIIGNTMHEVHNEAVIRIILRK